MLQKIIISNKSCTFERSKHQRKKMDHGFHATRIIMRSVSWGENKHIRRISEGSCDTEEWKNYAENIPTQE